MSGPSHFLKDIEAIRTSLDAVSPSMCVAKWQQVTIHLHNGTTHSCHHPVPHHIPLTELRDNPSALHNTLFKKQQRRLMLKGQRPPECQYCWNIEDAGHQHSDRHFKSSEPWARGYLEKIRRTPWHENVLPSYVELSFSNGCNFRCSYCSPQVSSHWLKEIKEHGPYILDQQLKHHDLQYLKQEGLMPREDEDNNPYVQAFWRWWPELYPQLQVLRLTGGEPLLSANTFRVLEEINKNPRPDLSLAINSNLGVPEALFQRFLTAVTPLCGDGKVADFTVFTSLDSSFTQAEYQRHGMHYEQVIANIHRLFQAVPKIRIVIMSTFNALSVTGFQPLLQQLLDFRRQYSTPNAWRIWLDIAYLRYPAWQSVQVLTPDFFPRLAELHQFMIDSEANKPAVNCGFHEAELEKMRRLINWAPLAQDQSSLNQARKNFYHFFSQHDRRRGTDFLKSFPEMTDFWQLCRELAHQT